VKTKEGRKFQGVVKQLGKTTATALRDEEVTALRPGEGSYRETISARRKGDQLSKPV